MGWLRRIVILSFPIYVAVLLVSAVWLVLFEGNATKIGVEITEFGVRLHNGVLVDLENKSVVAEGDGWAKIDLGRLDKYGVVVKVGDRHIVIPLEAFENASTVWVGEDGRLMKTTWGERITGQILPILAMIGPPIIFGFIWALDDLP